MLDANFWQNKSKSQIIIKEKKLYEELVNSYEDSLKSLIDLNELNELAIEEKNINIQNEILGNIKDLRETVKKNEIKCFLSNEADSLNCYIEIHAGAGGTESQDWAEMLRRMYLKWFDKKKFGYEIISEHKGEEAGIKSTTLKIMGVNLYGLMKKYIQSISPSLKGALGCIRILIIILKYQN